MITKQNKLRSSKIIYKGLRFIRDVISKSTFLRLFGIYNWCMKILPKSRLYLHITQKCNMRCKHCLYLSQDKNHFSPEEFDDLTFLKKFISENPIQYCTVSAEGEPLLNTHYDEIISMLRSYGIEIIAVTNGVLLDQHIDILLQNARKVVISLDASDSSLYEEIRFQGEDIYEKVLANIEKLVKRKRLLKSNTTISVKFDVYKKVQTHMREMILRAQSLDVDEVLFGTINDQKKGFMEPLFSDDEAICEKIDVLKHDFVGQSIVWPNLVNRQEVGFCDMLFNSTVINSSLALSPCCHIAGDEEKYGTVLQPKDELVDFRKKYLAAKSVSDLDYHCQHCPRRIVMK